MNAKKIFLIISCLWGTILSAQNVNIPDTIFKSFLVADTNINTNNDTAIQVSEALAYTGTIDVRYRGISDLTGIQSFTNLTQLYCDFNPLITLDISQNTALVHLSCIGTQLTSLNTTANVALDSLNCSNNQLTSLDISQNTVLTYLNCIQNQLTSLNLDSNTMLTYLDCYSNQLASLNVASNTTLISLNCSSNQLTSLNINSNTMLAELVCNGNQLTSLNVDSNILLTRLVCTNNNQIMSLDLSQNTALTYLECSNTGLTSLDVSQNTALIHLGCNYNSLTSLNIYSNTALTFLSCSYNNLTSLNVDSNILLTNLVCGNNQIPSLNVDSNTALTDLRCGGNQLTSLNINQNIALTTLVCGSNQITNLDISQNTNLTDLRCNANQLTSLDISQNTALIYLYCWGNQLTNLDLSQNTALSILNCSNNNLTSLDLDSNIVLTRLQCSYTMLTSLDVGQNTLLSYIHSKNNNQLTTMNLATGNNGTILTGVQVNNNPNLICIQHDVGFDPSTSWWQKDATAQWSDSCGYTIFVSSISIQGPTSAIVGNTIQMSAVVIPVIATDTTYTWSVVNGTGSATIDSNGLLTALSDGIVTVIATANDGSGVSDSITITISNQGTIFVSSISIHGSTSVIVGDTIQMSASVVPATATNNTYTWSVVNGTGSATIDSNGLLTALSDGIVTVVATANDGSGVLDSITITINNQGTIFVSSISIQGSTSVIVGGTIQMSASVVPATATNNTYTWSVVNGTGSATIDSNGLLTALSDGTVTVIATANDGSGVSDSITITISNQGTIFVSSISIQGSTSVTVGGTIQMSASVVPATATNNTYTWSVVNGTGLATIDSNGLLTALSDGIVTVVATANDGSGVSDSITITINSQGVGIDYLLLENLKIYPNPTYDILNISTIQKLTSIQLIDVMGKEVKTFDPDIKILDLQNLKRGIYFLKLSNHKAVAIVRVLKK